MIECVIFSLNIVFNNVDENKCIKYHEEQGRCYYTVPNHTGKVTIYKRETYTCTKQICDEWSKKK